MRLGGCVWKAVEACVDVEIATVTDGIGPEGARAQPTAAMEISVISAALIKRAPLGRRSIE